MTPNARCRHTAVANPFVEANSNSDDEDVANSNVLKPLDNRKSGRMLAKPPKSISMCFGAGKCGPCGVQSSTNDHIAGQDSPLHDANTIATRKAFKILKGFSKIHPTERNVLDEDTNGNNVPARRSLRDKLAKSRLVRSISGSSYNVQNKQPEEFERLVQEQQTPPTATRPSAFARLTEQALITTSTPEYAQLRSKLAKSLSSEAVLESVSVLPSLRKCLTSVLIGLGRHADQKDECY